MKNYEILKKVSYELGLHYETQDWGIINADPNRIKEFIFYYNNLKDHDSIKYELFELIIASFNESILEGSKENLIEENFVNFLKHNLTSPYTDILDYWNRIYNNEEFPVAKYFPSY